MDAMTPMTPEAKKLNDSPYERDHAQQLREAARRRALTLLLPPGRALDQKMIDDVASGPQTWAPFIVLRQRLAKAGANAIGGSLILSPGELADLEAQLRAGINQGSSQAEREAVNARRREVAT